MNPYYGRKWKVLVVKRAENENSQDVNAIEVSGNDLDTEAGPALKCTFKVERAVMQIPFYAEISIWNMAEDTWKEIVEEGMDVIIEAGYVNGPYGTIFDGQIFQPLFDRVNVTDFVTTLRCMDGLGIVTGNIINTTLAAGYDYNGIILEMAKRCRTPIAIGAISENLENKKLPRGKVLFGEPKKYLRQLCQDQNAQWFLSDGQLNLTKIDDEYEQEAVVITPETGLIGSPQQLQFGVAFRCLLNPEIKVTCPPMVVKLDNTVIRQTKARQGQYISPLDQDGLYKVVKVVYTGDTRGDEWYCDVIGINLVGKVSALYGYYNH